MKQYIGVKLINAKPMTRAEYNAFRGWDLPADENGDDAGFLVEYLDGGKANTDLYAGYVSWSPADVAEPFGWTDCAETDEGAVALYQHPGATGIEALVCEEIAMRQQKGIAKYGTTVADNPLALRKWLQHALEEALDQAVYLRRAIAELEAATPTDVPMTSKEVVDKLKKSGWRQKDISDALGMSPPNISRIASGKQDLRWRDRAILCDLLNQEPPRQMPKRDGSEMTSQDIVKTLIMTGWTQRDIGDAVGVTQASISRISTGTLDVKWKVRRDLCALLDQAPPKQSRNGNALP